jgi:hypothetical protein
MGDVSFWRPLLPVESVRLDTGGGRNMPRGLALSSNSVEKSD